MAYDTADFVDRLRCANATPHVAQHTSNRRSAIDGRTTRHDGYTLGQRIRKRLEEGFGWGKVIGPLRKVQVRGLKQVGFVFTLTCATYNLVRLRNLVSRAGLRRVRSSSARPGWLPSFLFARAPAYTSAWS